MLGDKRKDTLIKVIGIFYIIFGICAIINTIMLRHRQGPILWLCYICLILIGIGVLRKDDLLITTQLNIMAIPLVIWCIDFFYMLIVGSSLMGITNYFFLQGPITSKIITTQHLFTIPLTLFALYLIKTKSKHSWLMSFFQITLIFLATRIATFPKDNVNCVYKSCVPFSFEPYYVLSWFLMYFGMILIAHIIIVNLPFLKNKIKK